MPKYKVRWVIVESDSANEEIVIAKDKASARQSVIEDVNERIGNDLDPNGSECLIVGGAFECD